MASESISYNERQIAHDKRYMRAWASAPKRFLKAVEKMGLQCAPEDRDGMAINYEENYMESSYRPNMADMVDTHLDWVIEKYGAHNEPLIRMIAHDLQKPFQEEVIRNRSFLLGRVACYLIKEEGPNILSRVHALLHSIPGLAKGAGYGSLRISADKCRVSAEWLRRRRDKWCHDLAIPIPSESRKSVEACVKYKSNALSNHWRKQLFTVEKLNKLKQNGKHNGTNGNGTNGTNGHGAVRTNGYHPC